MGNNKLTRYDVARIHGIFVLDEAEAVHELDFGNLASAMSRKVTLNILFGDCAIESVELAMRNA